MKTNTKDDSQIAHFARTSEDWWTQDGPFAPLHKLNPCRIGFLREQIDSHFGLARESRTPMKGLSIVDIGCGGGLVCEPLSRLGAKVTGVDADEQAICVAAQHSANQGLDITYMAGAAEDLVAAKKTYDVVLALEIVEHVADVEGFTKLCASLLKPGGLLILSTLNRTWKSYALGIVVAERIIRWVPAGTHEWQRFLKPSELAKLVRASGLELQDVRGMVYNPLKKCFSLSPSDLDVNYFLVAKKP
ncbi:MAG: bifunctional 2-polyprenyl-6-hydroxyphenol methylase/3-demethylubiquinol 3-O-methyltransferase UbiG [Alphaproteobacteria bacterium]|nr:bifunctional 2-polyprenyl-6-hydroxyphenol methylase/3-demethylubiquinol 3-O-methyltransferase UbiG [Alphaproteobacteria bacterium]